MPVCVDASVVVAWLVPQQADPHVYELFDGWVDEGIELVGPALLYSEVVSVLRHQVHKGTLDEADAERLVRLLLRFGIRRIDNVSIYRRAYQLATRFGHDRAYDAHYLAVAEQEGCELWTRDRPLYKTVQQEMPQVKHTSLGR
ncbi:MAG: type II toxin-antitoxin system VapC family toxin [Dehalococcoidia bacterium]